MRIMTTDNYGQSVYRIDSGNELVSEIQKETIQILNLFLKEGLSKKGLLLFPLCSDIMLCECVPVGTRYCGIPTAIGDTGFYVPYGDPKATAEAIKEALNADKGKEARENKEDVSNREERSVINK